MQFRLLPHPLSRPGFSLSRAGCRAAALARAALAAAALAFFGAPALAADEPLDITLSYTVNLSQPWPAITNIITFNGYGDGSGAWWAADVPAAQTQWTIDDPFTKSSAHPPLEALMLGLVHDLPNDAPGQVHVVMMVGDAAATAARNVAWGTLFRGTLEADIVDAIQLATSGRPFADIQPGLDTLFAFADGDARTGILVPPGTPLSAWFALGAAQPGQTTTSSFTVMAFSDGQVLGSGVASLAVAVAAVPEPATATMWLAALLLLLAAGTPLQRRRAGSALASTPGRLHCSRRAATIE